MRVTYVEVWEHGAKGEQLYHNSWITDLDVDATNVAVVVQIGRTRWKIENEQSRVLPIGVAKSGQVLQYL